MADDVTITVRVNNQTNPGITSVQTSINRLQRSAHDSHQSLRDLRATLISLAPAAIPVAAGLTPIAVKAAAAGVAVAAFGAALMPQAQSLSNAADAQKKYTDAVTKYGAASKQARDAQTFLAQTFAAMPQATQRAAAGFLDLKDQFTSWSNSLTKFTMAPVTRSFAVAEAILPKLNPMVKEASTQFGRLVTVAGGAVASPGFDALTKKVTDFADRSLKQVVDEALHFTRVLTTGGTLNGPIGKFLQYAKENGPRVKDTLLNVAGAVTHLLEGAAQAGPGLLTLINAFAKLVTAVPASLIGHLMQVYTAFKLIRLAGAGIAAVSTSVTGLSTRLVALRAASVAAGGGVAGLRAAFMSLGAAGKANLIVAGLTIVAVALVKLSEVGRKAPPDIDKLTTSLGQLGRTGHASGEAARVMGKGLDGLYASIRSVSDPALVDKVQQGLVKVFSLGFADSTPVKEARQNLDAVDKALANLVKNGHAEQAAAAFEMLKKKYAASGHDASQLTSKLDDYKSALADQAFEQQLAAQSMGLFGVQAQQVQAKLDAQKASTDGLRQSIQALNDVQRAAAGGMIGFEAAIDNAAKAAKENGRTLDINTEKGRNNKQSLLDLAAATDAAAAAAHDSDGNWTRAFQVYDRGRSKLIATAEAMGLTESQAKRLANQILRTPDKTARLKGNMEDLQAKLDKAKAQLKTVPASKRTALLATISQLEAQIRRAKAEIASVKGKTVPISIYYRANKVPGAGTVLAPGRAMGGIVGAYAAGGITRGALSLVGEQGPELVRLPYGSTVYPAGQSRRMIADGEPFQAYASGGTVTAAERQARAGAVGAFGISHFGRMAGYRNTPLVNEISSPSALADLVGALGKWRGIIKAATSGATERGLLRALDRAAAGLIRHEKALTRVNAALERAKDKLSSLRDAAAQTASSVASGIIGGANITGSAQATGLTSTGRILDQLTQDRDKAAALAEALKALKGRGLNAQSLSEIAQAGVSGGGLATAEALMSASSADIQQINQLEKQLKASAKAAGKTTADALYGAGIKAAEGVVKGLEKQQHRLDKVMERAAKALERALERAFKRKAAGGVVGAAAGGLRGGMTWVGEQGPELVRLPYGSTVYPAGQSRQLAAAGGGYSGQPIVLVVNLDGKTIVRQIWDPLKREIRTRGGNVQAALTS